ncbi:hypothetical protein A6A27_20060 [Micromonospora sp. CB01531]|nr:hypothetical protein A6A27_20060 [Micromonospora sp. CB01531]
MATRRDQQSRANTPHPSPPTPPTRTADGEATTDSSHPILPGTLSMARYLTDPKIEDEIQALAAEAGLPDIDQAARLARLLRLHHQPAAPPHAA